MEALFVVCVIFGRNLFWDLGLPNFGENDDCVVGHLYRFPLLTTHPSHIPGAHRQYLPLDLPSSPQFVFLIVSSGVLISLSWGDMIDVLRGVLIGISLEVMIGVSREVMIDLSREVMIGLSREVMIDVWWGDMIAFSWGVSIGLWREVMIVV